MDLPLADALPPELKSLVYESGVVLGNVVKRETKLFAVVENLRAEMANLRGKPGAEITARLSEELKRLRKLKPADRYTVAKAFTFFLELMNACENAYRALRLGEKKSSPPNSAPGAFSLVYVLTAHPTEARAPENIAIFQSVQAILLAALEGQNPRWREDLFHQLELAWRAYPTRQRSPKVKDEALHIYRTSLEPEILRILLNASQEMAPLYLRTWVGGDKDGHPGVDENAMAESLSLSRKALLSFANDCLAEVKRTLDLLPHSRLGKELGSVRKSLGTLRYLETGEGARVTRMRARLLEFAADYEKEMGALHPELRYVKRLLHVFPALVMPLELREASDVIEGKGPLAIDRMLARLAHISRGGDPRWYARGLIVSMTKKAGHLLLAEKLVRKNFGKAAFPVIPLFETVPDLVAGAGIMEEFFGRAGAKRRGAGKASQEIMVGYSDSAKQGGVFPSRLAIAAAMHRLEAVALAAGVRPIFFQGSGGSIDRGGGSVPDQVAWWPRSALETYKVTVQGEMVERSFSSPEITRALLGRTVESVTKMLALKPRPPSAPALFTFAEKVRASYQELIHDANFLALVAKATPYAHLTELKIGSRPARRTKEISVEGLRAIPWVLCWTQTRVLLQTWWGVGSAWKDMNAGMRAELKKAFAEEPVFTSFVKALGFTVAKVELPVWKIYLDTLGAELAPELREGFYRRFAAELSGAAEMVEFLSGSENPLWFRPWLGASIRLRAPMIHPLNLLQVLALESGDLGLFRTSATGISSGMMTTG